MSNKYITTHYICNKCHKKYEFSDNDKNPGIRLYHCKHFSLKFIKNKDENELKYFVSIKCLHCSKRYEKKNINLEKTKKSIKYNRYACCGNEITIGAFFSEDENNSSLWKCW